MRKWLSTYFSPILLLSMLLTTACSSSDEPTMPENIGELKLAVAPPPANGRRSAGDPGSAVQENAEWNKLVVMLAYAYDKDGNPYNTLITSEWSKDDFYRLPLLYSDDDPDNPNAARIITINATSGQAYVYGISYYYDESDGHSRILDSDIKDCKNPPDGKTSLELIQALTISNNYGKGNANRFVSLASGFYRGMTQTATAHVAKTSGAPELINITKIVNGTETNGNPILMADNFKVITLQRLAAVVDIQWDVADTYKHANVKLTDFKFHGTGVEASNCGYGRLFPTLYDGSDLPGTAALTGDAIGGTEKFLNTSEISQRNGRVYHYVFPDGVGVPTMGLHLASEEKVDGSATPTTAEHDYTLRFDNTKLRPATWYKVNVSIKGNNGTNTTVTLTTSSQ